MNKISIYFIVGVKLYSMEQEIRRPSERPKYFVFNLTDLNKLIPIKFYLLMIHFAFSLFAIYIALKNTMEDA